MEDLILAIWYSLFNSQYSPLLGALLLLWAGFRLNASWSSRTTRNNRFNVAATEFLLAFSGELAVLKNPSTDQDGGPGDMLAEAFSRHRTAVDNFQRILSKRKRKKFIKVWHNYYAYDDTQEESSEYLIKYSPGWEGKPIWECRSTAISNIEKLHVFANYK